MAGASSTIVAATQNSLDSNKPKNEHKSNTAIMTTSVGGGLVAGAATELFFNRGYKLFEKNQDKIAANWPVGYDLEDKKERVKNLTETLRTTAHGTNEEMVNSTMRSIDDWSGRANKGESFLKRKPREAVEKALKSKVAANTFMTGMSTKKGRIFNYGFGTATSVLTGAFAINAQNKRERGEK